MRSKLPSSGPRPIAVRGLGVVVFYPHIVHRLYESLGFRRVPACDSGDVAGPELVFRLALRP